MPSMKSLAWMAAVAIATIIGVEKFKQRAG